MSKTRSQGTISIIGNFHPKKNPANGQTIKTKIISSELSRRFGNIQTFDTSANKILTLLYSPFLCFKALSHSTNVVFMPAYNGLRVFAPLLILENLFYHRKLHYVVIGGWLPDFLKQHKHLNKYIKKLSGVYVETPTMKTALEADGYKNVYVMPNCKDLQILNESDLVYNVSEPLKLCTFSRIRKEKGIEDAVQAVKKINDDAGRNVYALDIYGQIDPDQTDWFDALQRSFPPYVCYKGIVPYDKSVDVLKNYFSLLFPTYYKGEGLAGTLIDAMASGLPVIASDWKYNPEIVNERNGICYKTGDTQAFINLLNYIYTHQDEWNSKKVSCLSEARKFEISNVINVLVQNIG